jgi:post-segregation antitoxin (ccd killing protein)
LAGALGISLDWLLAKSGDANQPAVLSETIEHEPRLIAESHRVVSEARQQRWIEDNREALADANAFLARHGLWSDGKRQF